MQLSGSINTCGDGHEMYCVTFLYPAAKKDELFGFRRAATFTELW